MPHQQGDRFVFSADGAREDGIRVAEEKGREPKQ
jgi:hypothetical protein